MNDSVYLITRLHARQGFQLATAETSTRIPGPIDEETETLRMYWPLAAGVLPTGALAFPAVSTRFSILPALLSLTAFSTSNVKVRVFGFGINPFGPRMRPSLPT